MGVEDLSSFGNNPPFFAYLSRARYDKVAEAFGGKGYFVTQPEQIAPAMKDALSQKCVSVVNICIDTQSKRKEQQYPFELSQGPATKAKL